MSVGERNVSAVIVADDRVVWAGTADWEQTDDLTEVIARLAGESGKRVRRARVVLERTVVQLRTIVPAPPLRSTAARRWVALESPRLFRGNGAPLVTDARLVAVDKSQRALLAAAVPQPILRAIIDGCAQAGIEIDTLGPSLEVLSCALACRPGAEFVVPNGGTSEIVSLGRNGAWRSRLVAGVREANVAWHPALSELGTDAAHYANAFGAARKRTRLQLVPADARAAEDRRSRRRLCKLLISAIAVWIMAALIYATRLSLLAAAQERELRTASAVLDTALAERHELATARQTLTQFSQAERRRSRHLITLAQLTRALDDSTFLVSLQLSTDGRVRLVGYSPMATRVLAQLGRAALDSVRLETPPAREQLASGAQRDRFSIIARVREDAP